MSTLRKWRSRPAAAKSPSHAAQQPKDWGTKEVVRFLEQQGLNAYASAAKKSKLKGAHLLNSATTPFFNPPPPQASRSRVARRKKAESAYYDDISLLRLDARRPLLYADLMAEVHRLHGPLLLAILMQEGAKGVVRISYRDAEGDLVSIQSDDALRYAYEDWRKQARRQHTFMRLLVEVESTSPQCNK